MTSRGDPLQHQQENGQQRENLARIKALQQRYSNPNATSAITTAAATSTTTTTTTGIAGPSPSSSGVGAASPAASRVLLHHDELEEVQRHFSAVPLFDRRLAEELEELENQQAHFTHTTLHGANGGGGSRGASLGAQMGRSLSPANFGLSGGGVAAALSRSPSASLAHHRHVVSTPAGAYHQAPNLNRYIVPPPPKRPWSFEQLLRAGNGALAGGGGEESLDGDEAALFNTGGGGDEAGSRQQLHKQRHSQEEDGRRGSRTPRGRSSRGSRRKARVETHYSERANAAIRPPPDGSSTSSDADEPIDGVVAVLRREHAQAERERLEKERAEAAALQSTIPGTGGDGADDPTEKILEMKMDQETVDIHIEKAAMRRSMQKERLQRLGENPPGTRVEGGCQTDDTLLVPGSALAAVASSVSSAATTTTRSASTSGLTISEAPAFGNSRAPPPQPVGDRHPSNKTPPTGFLLYPAVSYTPASAAPVSHGWSNSNNNSNNATMVAPESFQQRRLDELARAYGPPSESSAATSGPTVQQQQQQQQQPQQYAFATPNSVLDRIDQIQLANEELLVRNRVLDKPSVLTPEENAFRAQVMNHVGAANKPPVKAQINAPLGGYGSFSDGTHDVGGAGGGFGTSFGGAGGGGLSDADARWRVARSRNENQGVSDVSTNEPLRKWASGSLLNSSPTSTIRYTPSKSSLRHESYNARKKWANVSFALPQDTASSGFLENLSGSAKSMMQME